MKSFFNTVLIAGLLFASSALGQSVPLDQEALSGHFQSNSQVNAGLGYEYFESADVLFLSIFDYNNDGSSNFSYIQVDQFDGVVGLGTHYDPTVTSTTQFEDVFRADVEVTLLSCSLLEIRTFPNATNFGGVETYTRIGECPVNVCQAVNFSPSDCN